MFEIGTTGIYTILGAFPNLFGTEGELMVVHGAVDAMKSFRKHLVRGSESTSDIMTTIENGS